MRFKTAFILLTLAGCVEAQALPPLSKLVGISKDQIEQRLGEPSATPDPDHFVYQVPASNGIRSDQPISNGCALHITFKNGVVDTAIGVETDELCRQFIRLKGF